MKLQIVVIALLFSCCTFGQWFNNISLYTTQNGLSNNTITCLQKDEAGFLWIGTHEGLNRYDGTEFVNILANSRNNIPSNNINRIVFINKNTLAVGTDAGLCLLNTSTLQGKVISIPYNSKFSATGFSVQDIWYKKDTKELWVATWHGLFLFTEKGELKGKIMGAEADLARGIFAKYLVADSHQEPLFYSQTKNAFYYPDFKHSVLVPAEKKNQKFSINALLKQGYFVRSANMQQPLAIFVLSKANTVSKDYLCWYDLKKDSFFIEQPEINCSENKLLYNAYSLNDSVFLLNSFFGEPLLYNRHTRLVTMAADKPLWFTSWPDGVNASLLKDEHDFWVGTSKGLVQSSEKNFFLQNNPALVNTIQRNNGLVSYNSAIYHNNKLWMACMGAGLFFADTITKEIQSIFSQKTPPSFIKKLVSTNVVTAGDLLWLNSVYGPVEVNESNQSLSLVNARNKDSSFDDHAGYAYKDSRGNIWYSLPDGVCSYNIAYSSFTNYRSKYRGGSFPLLKAGPKTEDANGNIWMARLDTLVKFNPVSKKFSWLLLTKNGKPLRAVSAMAFDGDDALYLSVAGGFGIYHISLDSIDLFTKQTGIISTAINDIVSDKEGNAWIATEGGLVFYHREKMKFSSFTKADGLPDDNVTGINFTGDDKKTLFLGFSKTYCLFQPSLLLQQKWLPLNKITGVEVNGKPLDFDYPQTLSYDENNISFTYTGINFNQGQQNNYSCMLEGVDLDWKYPGSERKINYINLPVGQYTFKVKAANHQGEWNEHAAIFSFEIKPPFWQQWWFRLLMLAAVVSLIYYFIRQRETAIQKENKVQLQMSELRMQALRAQMNPHFIFNSLNSIQNYILSSNTIDAASYLSKFARLVRRILDQSKHNFLPLYEVIETLKMYVELEAFRFNNELNYSFKLEANDELMDTLIPPMLLQPFVENAILHGLMPKNGERNLLVECRLVNGNAEIIIDDNGVGRHQHVAAAGHESQGEKLTAGMLDSLQQIRNIKASIDTTDKMENNVSAGTTVKIILCLKTN